MGNIRAKLNWYDGHDYDPKKEVLRYGKMVTLER